MSESELVWRRPCDICGGDAEGCAGFIEVVLDPDKVLLVNVDNDTQIRAAYVTVSDVLAVLDKEVSPVSRSEGKPPAPHPDIACHICGRLNGAHKWDCSA